MRIRIQSLRECGPNTDPDPDMDPDPKPRCQIQIRNPGFHRKFRSDPFLDTELSQMFGSGSGKILLICAFLRRPASQLSGSRSVS